jgi:hypothetical protein
MLRGIQFRRLVDSAASVAVVLVIPLTAVVLTAVLTMQGSPPLASDPGGHHSGWASLPWSWIALGGFLVALAIAALRTWEEYRRTTYDPTWALKFQERFDNMWVTKDRQNAARVLRDQKANLSKIDDDRFDLSPIDEVLDFFEDIGFYTFGRHISPEAAHHHFFHWIRGYYENALPYITAWRAKEAARWGRLSWLYLVTKELEARAEKKSGRAGAQEDLATFLEEEISLPGDDEDEEDAAS